MNGAQKIHHGKKIRFHLTTIPMLWQFFGFLKEQALSLPI
jgi:hypothetical protein